MRENESLEFPLARAAIFAQGSGKNWYNPLEGYTYADQGNQQFTFYLAPHGGRWNQRERYHLAALAQKRYLYLADNLHQGSGQIQEKMTRFSMARIDLEQVVIMAVKQSEDGDGLIFRLLETEGEDCEGTITILEKSYPFAIGHNEILTLKYEFKGQSVTKVNLLERAD